MLIISAAALKGGVGKSSLVHHLSGTLAAAGRKVLLLDNDPQASLSSAFWGPATVEGLDPDETMAALYAGIDPFPEQVIKPSGIAGIDIIPGSKAAADHNTPRPHESPDESQACIRSFLSEVSGYDVCLIDNPPNLNLATWASLVASGYLIVPAVPEDYGTMSLGPVMESIGMVMSSSNPSLKLLGLVLTMVQPRLSVHILYEKLLRDLYTASVFEARIPLAADIKEAVAARKPIAQYKPKGASSKAFRALSEEVMSRIAGTDVDHDREAA